MSIPPPPPASPPPGHPPPPGWSGPTSAPPGQPRRSVDGRALAIVGAAVVLVVVVAIAVTSGGGDDDGAGNESPATSPPQGPTAGDDFATVLFEEPADAEPLDGFVLAGANRVTVEAVAHPGTVTDEQGQALAPPPNHRFIAVQLTFESGDQVGGPAAAGTGLAVVDGGRRADLTGLLSDDGLYYQDGWVAAVVPAGDDREPRLEVIYRGHVEQLDLRTGERVGGSELLYEPRSVDLNHDVPEAEIPVTVPVPAPHAASVNQGGYQIVRAELTAFEANRGWAPDGQAWLVVTVEGLIEPYLSDFDEPGQATYFRFAPWESFTVDADGETIAPENAGPSADGGGLAVVFVVPEDLRSTTVHAAPRWLVNVEGHELTAAAPAVDVPVDLS